MTTIEVLEHHRFESAGQPFVYLVPSAAVFGLDPVADAVMQMLDSGPRTLDEMTSVLDASFERDAVLSTIGELRAVRAIGETVTRQAAAPAGPARKVIPLTPFPLTTMVLNVTNQCNLACTYCYEYSADKIVDTENGKQVMDIMQRLNKETGVTFVFATHDPRVINYANRVVTLQDGLITKDSKANGKH